MATVARPLAMVTGASTGIGYELAVCCAERGFDLLIAADEPAILDAKRPLQKFGSNVDALQVDLSTREGIDELCAAAADRPVDALLANAGRGLGGAFLDQDFSEARHVIDTNVTGTVCLVQRIGREMRERDRGRILITSSVAALMPGAYQAIYNATKSFLDSFAFALRSELRDTSVTVTSLMPGPTDTEFFARGNLLDTKLGRKRKDDPAMVARAGFDAMMKGEGDVVSGWHNKLQAAILHLLPASAKAALHRRQAEPGTASS